MERDESELALFMTTREPNELEGELGDLEKGVKLQTAARHVDVQLPVLQGQAEHREACHLRSRIEDVNRPLEEPESVTVYVAVDSRGASTHQHHPMKAKPSSQQDQLPAPKGKMILREWKDGGNAPFRMGTVRGAAVVDGNVVYFINLDGQAYSYTFNKRWIELPKCPHVCSSYAVVRGFLTAIGGSSRPLIPALRFLVDYCQAIQQCRVQTFAAHCYTNTPTIAHIPISDNFST